MTPTPSKRLINTRHAFNPKVGTIHILNLANMLKDGIYAKDRVGDGILGVVVFAVAISVVPMWVGSLFQIPFLAGLKYRQHAEKFGHPFYGPDGKVVKIGDRVFNGGNSSLEVSSLDLDGILIHPNYGAWRDKVLYAGEASETTTWVRQYTYNSKKACDNHVNNRDYTPGPLGEAPDTPYHPDPHQAPAAPRPAWP